MRLLAPFQTKKHDPDPARSRRLARVRWIIETVFGQLAERYHVKRTYSHQELTSLLAARGLAVLEYRYQFRSRRAQQMYLGLSAYGGKFGFNAAAPAAPLVAASDRAARGDGESISDCAGGD